MEALTTAYLQFRQPRVGGMSSDLPSSNSAAQTHAGDSSGGEDAPACELPLHADLAAPSEPAGPTLLPEATMRPDGPSPTFIEEEHTLVVEVVDAFGTSHWQHDCCLAVLTNGLVRAPPLLFPCAG